MTLLLQESSPYVVRLAWAFALSAILAYRPWRRVLRRGELTKRETAQTHTLVAVAGALMVEVIGDSVARAFGVAGLGALIRFRAGIKDTRDAALMFIMIGLGMACGLGAIQLALHSAAFAVAVLLFFDLARQPDAPVVRVALKLGDARTALARLRERVPSARIVSASTQDMLAGTLLVELPAVQRDAAKVQDFLEQRGLLGIHSIALEE